MEECPLDSIEMFKYIPVDLGPGRDNPTHLTVEETVLDGDTRGTNIWNQSSEIGLFEFQMAKWERVDCTRRPVHR